MDTTARQLFSAFAAQCADSDMRDRLALFGRFVGSWDLKVTDFGPRGERSTSRGEWHFGWALAGRAIADVWICPRRTAAGASPGKHGLSVRFPDAVDAAWRSVWIEPRMGVVRTFVAQPVPSGEIVLHGHFDDLGHLKWTFSDIGADAFSWRNERSDDGRCWHLSQSFEARRA